MQTSPFYGQGAPALTLRSFRTVLVHASLLVGGLAQAAPAAGLDLSGMSLEALGNIEVVSLSRNQERLGDAIGAVYVISAEAIAQSGAHNLPEALRLAPNIAVAQVNAHQYAISARGFNSTTANKLLVMIDGRTVYTPLYSGVFWDAQAVALADVARIEVISGPGGALWGANAVNGVINVITRPGGSAPGSNATVSAGTDGTRAMLRYGSGNVDSGWRVYGMRNASDATEDGLGRPVRDAYRISQVGWRTDREVGTANLTIQGDMYQGSEQQPRNAPTNINGANLLAVWQQLVGENKSLRLQAWYDHTRRDMPGTFSEELNTFDLDLLLAIKHSRGAHTTLGAGYRVADDQVTNSAALAFLPAHKRLHWANVYAGHEHRIGDQLRVIGGIKFETNDYTGLEWLPSLKMSWKPTAQSMLWGGWSRAVRAPSRIDTDFNIPGNAPYFLVGNPDFRSEIARTVELGWRTGDDQRWSYSATLFHSRYEHLRSMAQLPGGKLTLANGMGGEVNGLDTWLEYRSGGGITMHAGAMLLDARFDGASTAAAPPGYDPRSMFKIAAGFDIGPRQQLWLRARRVGGLSYSPLPAYSALDARLSWRVSDKLEWALEGRNLNGSHQEFASGSAGLAGSSVIPRSLRLTLKAGF